MTTTSPTRRAARAAAAGPDRIPKRSQGFYRDPNDATVKLRSVTTILEQGVPKGGLVYWAGDTVAQCAMENLPTLIRASMSPAARIEAQAWLSAAHRRKKDERAAIGSAVHKVIEAHILGIPIPDDLFASEADGQAADAEDVAAHVKQFLRFVEEFEVEFSASEMVVANDTEKYAGTLDWLAVSPKIVALLIAAGLLEPDADPHLELMGDTKTGGDICWGDAQCVKDRPSAFKKCPGGVGHSIKGVYAEAGLQMAAYREGERVWVRNGDTAPMPPTHPVGIALHLQADGYLPIPVACGPAVFDHFRYARRVAEWTSETSKSVIAAPLTIPAPVDDEKGAA